jgi:hypothetical protein
MRASIHGGFLSVPRLSGLFILYALSAIGFGVVTFLVFLSIARPEYALWFVGGIACGATSMAVAKTWGRRGRDKAARFIHHLHDARV